MSALAMVLRMRRCAVALVAALTACADASEPGAATGATGAAPDAAPSAVAIAAVPIEPATIASPLVAIPALTYRPLFAGADQPSAVALDPLWIEECAVTNAQFRAFVLANPQWRRSGVPRLFADESYLAHWRGDVDLEPALLECPVTNVSWFAARAYARWIGRRLPTVGEWEAVAAASGTQVIGRGEPDFVQRILDWYGRPTPVAPERVRSTFRNVHGVWDMHGLIWEWVADFNTALVTGESRGDTGLERNLFCGAGSIGAADPADYAAFMRFAFRSSLVGDYAVRNLGFRCVADAGPPRDKE